jgi:hypothetical protein
MEVRGANSHLDKASSATLFEYACEGTGVRKAIAGKFFVEVWVSVEVNDGQGTMPMNMRADQRIGYGVVTAHSEQTIPAF